MDDIIEGVTAADHALNLCVSKSEGSGSKAIGDVWMHSSVITCITAWSDTVIDVVGSCCIIQ